MGGKKNMQAAETQQFNTKPKPAKVESVKDMD